MKKLLTATLATTMLFSGTMGISANESTEPTVKNLSQNYEEINLTDEQEAVLQRYQNIFIDTGMYNEFTVTDDGALSTTQNYSFLKAKYNVSDNDIQFVKNFVTANQMAVQQAKTGIRTRLAVKNFRVYLTYKETKSYLGTVVTSGPIAVIGALAALGMTVGGPAGAVISGVAGIYGASYVVTVTRKAIKQKKGVWVGWGGIGIN